MKRQRREGHVVGLGRRTRPKQPFPLMPSDDTVRRAALGALVRLAVTEPFGEAAAFTLRERSIFSDEFPDSPEATFARLLTQGRSSNDIADVLGLDVDAIVCGLVDLCRGATVSWIPRKAVA